MSTLQKALIFWYTLDQRALKLPCWHKNEKAFPLIAKDILKNKNKQKV